MPRLKLTQWGLLALLVSLIAACSPTAAPPAAPPAAPTTAPQPATQSTTAAPAAGAAAQPTAQQAAPAANTSPKGTIVVGDWQEPKGLVWPVFAQAHTISVLRAMYYRPITTNEKDEMVAEMLDTIPSTANGGISADGKTVTAKFKTGFAWHDGKPVTAEDFKFTWQFIVDPKNKAQSSTGWSEIEAVDVPDPLTAVIKLKKPSPNFVAITLIHPLLPKHLLENVADPAASEYARKPVGNGPFMFKEWIPGDRLVMVANPNAPLPPKVAELIFKFVPDVNTLLAMVRTGDIDIAWDLKELNIPQLRAMNDVETVTVAGVGIDRYYYNLRDPKDLTKPHPIFGDINVRKAIGMAMDRQTAVDKILQGAGKIATSEMDNTPWFNEALQPLPYDPEGAKKLLDDAGWKAGPDGIRVKDGMRLSFKHSMTAGDQVRENMQVVFQQNLKDIGVDMVIENHPSAKLFGSCGDSGVWGTSSFDMMGFSLKPSGVDTSSTLATYFLSANIKDCQTNPTGNNAMGFKNAEVDKTLECINTELDPAKRLTCVKEAQKIVQDQHVVIYLYDRLDIYGVNKRVQGVKPTVFGAHDWNYRDWSVTN